MNIKVVLLCTLIGTTGLTVPAIAQIRNPSQDFFDQGREQLEREIQVLQGESLDLGDNHEKQPSEPILNTSPAPTPPPNETPNEVKTPTQQPNQVDKPEQRIQN